MFTSSLAWNDAEFDGEFLFGCYTGQTQAEGCVNGSQDLDGAPPVNAPELQATFGVVYEFALSQGFRMELNASAAYSDDFFTEQEHGPRSIQKSFWIFNTGMALHAPQDRWSVSVTGRNLGNEHICAVTGQMSRSLAFPAVDYFCSTQRARQIWGEFEVRF